MQLTDVLKIGFEKGQVCGIFQECGQWETAGHSHTCSTVANSSTIATNTGTQVDLIAPMPRTGAGDASAQSISTDIPTSCSDASTQSSADFDPLNNAESIDVLCAFSAIAPSSTPLGLVWQRAFEAGAQASQVNTADDLVIPPHVNVSFQTPLAEPPPLAVQMMDATHLDWADDVESLFAQPPPLPHQLRDLSSLHSSSPCPFASLQRRSKCQGSHRAARRNRRLRYMAEPLQVEYPYREAIGISRIQQ